MTSVIKSLDTEEEEENAGDEEDEEVMIEYTHYLVNTLAAFQ